MPAPSAFWCAKVCALLLSFFSLFASPAATHALTLTYFSWQPAGVNAYTATAGSVSGNAVATIPGNDVVQPRALTFTSPSFISQFGVTIPNMVMNSGVSGSAADSLVQFSFNKSLPTGSRLIVFDVDIAIYDERLQLSQVGGTLTLLSQLETSSGAASVFPSWTPATGMLSAQGSQNDNNYEATVFDVSGATAVSARFLRSSGGAGIAGAHLAIGVPIPEPTSAWLSAIALSGLMLRTARSNGFKRPFVLC